MTEPRDDDVKAMLGRMFNAEPPLSLDRDEIFRTGRRKVRNRRLVASGGVAASVVAVVVGAATLTNLVGGSGNEVTPAFSSTTPETPQSVTTSPEPGLSLPLPPTEAPQSTPVPPRAIEPERHAAALTAVLAAANPVPKNIKAYPGGDQTKPPLTFTFFHGGYHANAHLLDSRGTGSLEVEVAYLPDPNAKILCEQSTEHVSVNCSVSGGSGYQMTKTTRTDKRGVVEYTIRVARSDGTDVWVTATNVSSVSAGGSGENPVTAPTPLLDYPDLEKIAKNSRLTYG
jgi:hypothetical protein